VQDSSDASLHFGRWKGSNYDSPGLEGKRVLILGESHYEWLDNQTLTPDWTQRFIEAGFAGEKQRFRTRVAAVLLGRPPVGEEIRAFWNSVAFANYIPVSVGKGPSARPDETMWAAAVPRFAALVAELKPNLLLVLGHPLWGRMHYTFSMDGHLEVHSNSVSEYRIWRYRLDPERTMLACAIAHPSRSFNFRTWHPFVRDMLKAA
jgi:hypothetical protein